MVTGSILWHRSDDSYIANGQGYMQVLRNGNDYLITVENVFQEVVHIDVYFQSLFCIECQKIIYNSIQIPKSSYNCFWRRFDFKKVLWILYGWA